MTQIIKVNPKNPDQQLLRQAAELLSQGKVIGYPTETVYGLGVNAFDPEAVERLYRLKERAAKKSVILLIEGEEMLRELVTDVPTPALRLLESFWPGPLTIIFRTNQCLPPHLQPTVALRVSSHPIASGLVRELKKPLVSSSANISGVLPARSAQQVQKSFPQGLDLIIDGGLAGESAVSTIVDVTAGKITILREGKIGLEELQLAVGERILQGASVYE